MINNADTLIEGSPQGTGVIPFPKTSGPGCLKSIAVIWSETTHPPPIFALNMSGRASKALIEVASPQ